jgi:hypothetical protein
VIRVAAYLLAAALAGCAAPAAYEKPQSRPLPAGVSFAGRWDSTWGKMILRQDGHKISGSFTGYRDGGLTGTVEGDLFRFIWDQRQPRQHGHGFMQITPDGMHLEGRWGYLDDEGEGGRWAADRELEGG